MVSDERPNDSASSSGEKCFSVSGRLFVVGSICPISRGTITLIYPSENLPKTFRHSFYEKYPAENFSAGLGGFHCPPGKITIPNVTVVALGVSFARFAIHDLCELAPRFAGL
jgi:hypothetical protein